MLLRAAAEAAERDVVLAPATAPGWSASARRCRSRGPTRRASCWCGCSPPAAACCRSGRRWRRPARSTRSCPSGSGSGCCRTPRSIHRFTVDRHVVETCIEASALIRQRRAARRADGRRAAARHRQGRADRAQRRGGADRPRDRRPGWASTRSRPRPDRDAGTPPPAARGDRDHPRPRRPGDRGAGDRRGSTRSRCSSCSRRSPRPTPGPPPPRRGRPGGPGWCTGWSSAAGPGSSRRRKPAPTSSPR